MHSAPCYGRRLATRRKHPENPRFTNNIVLHGLVKRARNSKMGSTASFLALLLLKLFACRLVPHTIGPVPNTLTADGRHGGDDQ